MRLHTTLTSHWSRPTPTQRLPFSGHALCSCNAGISLITAYTDATLAFRWPRLTPTQCLFPESFCLFCLQLDVSVNNIHRVHRRSRWYITMVDSKWCKEKHLWDQNSKLPAKKKDFISGKKVWRICFETLLKSLVIRPKNNISQLDTKLA